MMKLKLAAEERTRTGTGGARAARNAEMIPAVVYARGEENLHVKLDEVEFRKVQRKAGAADILGLDVNGTEIPVLIKEVQKDPIRDYYLHVDLQKVSMDELIRVIIPITLINREDIKIQPSLLAQQLDEIEIECLPSDLPEGDIEVDVKDMEIGDSIFVSDLEVSKNEKITILRDLDDVICSLSAFIEEDVDEIDEDLEVDVEPELVSDEDEEVEEE